MDCQARSLSIFVGYTLCYKDSTSQFICVILIPTAFLIGLDTIAFVFKRPFSQSQSPEAVLRDKLKGHESGSREIRRWDVNTQT